jgi:hypothetical protein
VRCSTHAALSRGFYFADFPKLKRTCVLSVLLARGEMQKAKVAIKQRLDFCKLTARSATRSSEEFGSLRHGLSIAGSRHPRAFNSVLP